IESFHSLSQTADHEGLTAGISTALLTTLAGLVTALSGVYCVYRLQKKSERMTAQIQKCLTRRSQEGN
ncbi:MAG: MotA/TolQ/ExbB proton channel family protein, partial [Sutterellaceae bacterium]|nr:MotA/TolQ/ExbB proton channel family protein [Sutterellaceae bacterium]